MTDKAQGAAEELRELIQEAHGAMKDLRRLLRETREVQREVAEEVETRFVGIVETKQEEVMGEYTRQVLGYVDSTEKAIFRRFDTITSILMGTDDRVKDLVSDAGKKDLEEMILDYVVRNGPPMQFEIKEPMPNTTEEPT